MCHVTPMLSRSCGKSPYTTANAICQAVCSQVLLHLDAPPASTRLLPQPAANPHSWRKGSFQLAPWKSAGVPRIRACLLHTGAQDTVKAVNPAAHQPQAQQEQIRPCTWDAPRHLETARTEPARLQCYIPRHERGRL